MKTLERLRQDWLLATEISKLESRLWSLARRDGLETVMITSAVRGEGKSTTVAYLATSMGLFPDRKVVAVDFDFRIPAVNGHFGLEVENGVDRVLAGERALDEALIHTEIGGLDLLLCTPGGADPSLLLHTSELRGLLKELRSRYDLVLLDTPAILPVPDSTVLMPFADGVVLTAMAGWSTEPQLKRAQEICRGLDATILGLVVGNVQEAAPEYVGGNYHYYGYHDGRAVERDAKD